METDKLEFFIFPWNTIINKTDTQYTLWDVVLKALNKQISNSQELDNSLQIIHSNKIHKNITTAFLDNYYSSQKRKKIQPVFDRSYLFSRIIPVIIKSVLYMRGLFRNFDPRILHSSGTVVLSRIQALSLLSGSLLGIINFYSEQQNNTLNLMRIFRGNNIQFFEAMMIYFNNIFENVQDIDKEFKSAVDGVGPAIVRGDIVIKKAEKIFNPDEWKNCFAEIKSPNIITKPGDPLCSSLIHLVPCYSDRLLEDTFQLQQNISLNRKEELFYIYSPEMMLADMFCSPPDNSSGILVMGAESFHDTIDYPKSSDGTIIVTMLLVDATEFGNSYSEYTSEFYRDLNKLDAVLRGIAMPDITLTLAASDWGYTNNCDNSLKFLQLLLTTSKNNIGLNYITRDEKLTQYYTRIANMFRQSQSTVGEVFKVYSGLSEKLAEEELNGNRFKKPQLYDYIYGNLY